MSDSDGIAAAGPRTGVVAPAISAVLAVSMLVVAAAYVIHRASTPSDGTRGGYVTSSLSAEGLVVAPIPGATTSLADGDVVQTVHGVTLESWARSLFGVQPGQSTATTAREGFVAYDIERNGESRSLTVALAAFPLAPALADYWATILFATTMLLVAAYVFIRRPRDEAADALLIMGSALLASSVPWLLGFQALDLVGGWGFWLWASATFVVYGIFWMAVLHFALVFPRPSSVVRRRPWLIAGLYAVPFVAWPALAATTIPASGSVLEWIRGWTSVQLVVAGAVSVAAFALVVTTYFWRSGDADRRRLRWVALAAGFAAIATLAVWIAPQVVLGSPLLPWNAIGIAGLGFPVAIAIAILRHQLFDIDVLISRSVLYGGLTVGVAAIYGGVVAILEGVMQEGGEFAIPLLATGIGAFAMIPLYRWLSSVTARVWPATAPAAPGIHAAVSSAPVLASSAAPSAYDVIESPATRRRRATSLVLSRTVVYVGLTAAVLVVYGISVAGLGSLLGGAGVFGISLLATGLAAIVALPLRDELQGAVNRMLYGDRDSPYRAIARLGERLEHSVPTQAVLPTIVETVAGALRLPYVAIELEQEGQPLVAAATGTARGKLLRVPIVYRAQRVGDLVLAQRSSADPFSSADRRLLTDLARQAGAAAESVRLTSELQRSRERLVATREEERRRLRRELHDGLGPALAGALLKVSAARTKLPADPEATGKLLNDVELETRSAIEEVRRLARDLRPPALDELGLLSAVREQARYFSSDGLDVSIVVPDQLPALAAAVEVATYRILLEAMTNAARHSGARHCRIEIALADGTLELDIIDDGTGIGPNVHRGVGMTSMSERAAELGGTLDVSPGPSGGTRVHAMLPLVGEA